MTPDINFVRFRPPFKIPLTAKRRISKTLQQLGLAVSGAALVSSVTGYAALMIGRSVPTALALGTLGSVGMAINTKLKGM